MEKEKKKVKVGYWEYFLNSSAVYAFAVCLILCVWSTVEQLITGTGEWYFGLLFLIPVIAILIGVYMNWKKHWL
jgi:hypothetical protein